MSWHLGEDRVLLGGGRCKDVEMYKMGKMF